jgi:hypothetical protein
MIWSDRSIRLAFRLDLMDSMGAKDKVDMSLAESLRERVAT